RVRTRLPRHPAPVRVLCREARGSGLYRIAPLRAAARPQSRPGDDGPITRIEYAAVLMGEDPASAGASARPADLPTGSRRAGDLLGGASRAPGAPRRAADGRDDMGKRDRPGRGRLVSRAPRVRGAED